MDGKKLICLEEGFILFVLLKGSAPSLAQKWEEEKYLQLSDFENLIYLSNIDHWTEKLKQNL